MSTQRQLGLDGLMVDHVPPLAHAGRSRDLRTRRRASRPMKQRAPTVDGGPRAVVAVADPAVNPRVAPPDDSFPNRLPSSRIANAFLAQEFLHKGQKLTQDQACGTPDAVLSKDKMRRLVGLTVILPGM